ncbi:MAG: hypothetical protein J1F36_06365 [Clostridiales bacterium]|nr:hypothetical protein [Clostridiales bacterium]
MSKEVLLEQINIKAKEQAESIKRSANDAASAQRAKVEAELKAEYEKRLASVNEEAELAIAGQKTLMRIDGKKSELNAKRELIDEVYKNVTERIKALSDNDYRKFIAAIIAKYAEDGDKVIICQNDVKRLNSNWLSDLAFDLQLSLSFASEYHGDVGGVILRGNKYDKNLTVSAIIGEARIGTESAVAKRLFG